MKIAIIGMGVAGISVLREWTKEKEIDPSIEITVFGDENTFGTGTPYQKDNEVLLMNQPSETITIIPENKNDFEEWAQKKQNQENKTSNHYPRQLFGAYLTDRMNDWLLESKAEIIKEKVKMVQMLPNNQLRLTSSSSVKDFDAVHLCIGGLAYKDYYQLINHPNFIVNPFPVEKKLSIIPHGATVGVVGTGLTGIDIFRYTYYNRPDLKVSFFSPSGRFKSIRGKSKAIDYQFFTAENIKNAKEKNNGFIPLETYVEWFKNEVAYQQLSLKNNWKNDQLGSKDMLKEELRDAKEIGAIQNLLHDMSPFLAEIWMALCESDKQVFFDKYYEKWDKLRSSFPAATGKELVTAWEENKISVFDNIIDIVENEQSFEFILKDQKSQHADYLINAAGTEKNISFKMDRMPLVSQLVNERLLQPETFGGVQISLPSLSAVSQKYGILHTLKVHGELISGIQFGNNSVNIVSESARPAVRDIIQQLKGK
ncbi:FAD/NAD(P)-binding protein [Carnobacterium alterfunditum]|uniref:FAD/NAD(P)-binding protein n=1 Tax=Carnobacterium alterfunditum TaxID=28230 RepID=UPI003594464E